MKLKIFLRLFGVIAIILTIFPYISANEWYVRIFDFPHLQLTLLTMVALLTYFIGFDIKSKTDYVFVIALGACFIFQGFKIYPYTAFAKFEVKDSSAGNPKDFSIYTANVLQKNEDRQSLLSDIRANDADVLLFTETNKEWVRSLSEELDRLYDYKVEVPLENTYGMLLFSKLKLHEPQVRYMIEDTIPSIHSKIILNAKDTIQLFAIHPAPPTPQHNPSSVDRDAEMMKIAKHARDSELPVIVLGDFNDVAWSETTSLFQKVSGLLDMRKGRGLYSTYNAKSWIMRWPLDHVFTSADFRIKKVHRGSSIGSDHFPFYAKLSYEPQLAKEQMTPPPTEEQLKKAFEQIDEGQAKNNGKE
jgi:endonuclease/exonuclease/phosphatase (EEP) superfamily protein YafD